MTMGAYLLQVLSLERLQTFHLAEARSIDSETVAFVFRIIFQLDGHFAFGEFGEKIRLIMSLIV